MFPHSERSAGLTSRTGVKEALGICAMEPVNGNNHFNHGKFKKDLLTPTLKNKQKNWSHRCLKKATETFQQESVLCSWQEEGIEMKWCLCVCVHVCGEWAVRVTKERSVS